MDHVTAICPSLTKKYWIDLCNKILPKRLKSIKPEFKNKCEIQPICSFEKNEYYENRYGEEVCYYMDEQDVNIYLKEKNGKIIRKRIKSEEEFKLYVDKAIIITIERYGYDDQGDFGSKWDYKTIIIVNDNTIKTPSSEDLVD